MLSGLDWAIIFTYFAFSLVVGLAVGRRAGKSTADYFAAGRQMPWWLLGISMVATTFSTDTPNVVTDFVRNYGIAGNWLWWAFVLTGLLTVFVYARLWKRSGVLTDIEFYELRYSGKGAAFLRGFRALYLGAVFNVIVMASVSLAAIKIGAVLLHLTPLQTILLAGVVTVIYCAFGGLLSVLLTDVLQFILAMAGAIAAAYFALNHPAVGGLSGLLTNPLVADKLDLFPSLATPDVFITIFLMPLAVQWWSVWYPGAEPGGGGYIAQRMFAAKDERNAVGAVFAFNVLHYALRPWPWFLVALCSLVVFPDLDSLHEAFPQATGVVNHDMGYPAMLTFLPAGLIGLVVASLIAAYMSTISTHLNWGSSYIVNDFYRRFVRPGASEREYVNVGRIATVVLMIIAGTVALQMTSAMKNFQIMLQIGAGTGLLFILRWFWWRINVASEIAAMVVSFVVAVYFYFVHERIGFAPLASWQQLLIGVSITTVGWLGATFLTRPTDMNTLLSFLRLVQPGGPGWAPVMERAHRMGLSTVGIDRTWQVPQGILCMILGTAAIWSAIFATGYWIYGRYLLASAITVVCLAASAALAVAYGRLMADDAPEARR